MAMVVPSPGRAGTVAVVMMAAPDMNRESAGRRGRRTEQTQREDGSNQGFHVMIPLVDFEFWRVITSASRGTSGGDGDSPNRCKPGDGASRHGANGGLLRRRW